MALRWLTLLVVAGFTKTDLHVTEISVSGTPGTTFPSESVGFLSDSKTAPEKKEMRERQCMKRLTCELSLLQPHNISITMPATSSAKPSPSATQP